MKLYIIDMKESRRFFYLIRMTKCVMHGSYTCFSSRRKTVQNEGGDRIMKNATNSARENVERLLMSWKKRSLKVMLAATAKKPC